MTLSYHRNPTPTEVLSGAIKCEKEKSGETEKSRSKACLISPSIRVVIALEDITRVTERPCARSIVHGPVCVVTTHRYHCMFDRLSDTLWPLLSSRSVGRSMHIMMQLLNDWSCGIYLVAAYSQMLWPYDLSYSFLTAIFFSYATSSERALHYVRSTCRVSPCFEVASWTRTLGRTDR